jgi:hypothetical protein
LLAAAAAAAAAAADGGYAGQRICVGMRLAVRA